LLPGYFTPLAIDVKKKDAKSMMPIKGYYTRAKVFMYMAIAVGIAVLGYYGFQTFF